MPETTRKAPSFEGVAAGQTATCRLPIGRTFHQLLIPYSGATLAQLDALRIVANGEVIQRHTECANLDSKNQFEGRAAASGVLVVDFDRYNMRTRASEELTALGTGYVPKPGEDPDPRPVTTLAVEIDINAAAVGPVLGPVKMVQSAPQPSGLIKKVREFIYNPSGAGDYEISDLPKGDMINKVYFLSAAAVINSIKVERDNFIVFERTKAENELVQTDGVRVPQANWYVYDPTEKGNGVEGLVTQGVNDLRFTLNMAGAGAVTAVVEYLGILEG